jgi:hypothetical protein
MRAFLERKVSQDAVSGAPRAQHTELRHQQQHQQQNNSQLPMDNNKSVSPSRNRERNAAVQRVARSAMGACNVGADREAGLVRRERHVREKNSQHVKGKRRNNARASAATSQSKESITSAFTATISQSRVCEETKRELQQQQPQQQKQQQQRQQQQQQQRHVENRESDEFFLNLRHRHRTSVLLLLFAISIVYCISKCAWT